MCSEGGGSVEGSSDSKLTIKPCANTGGILILSKHEFETTCNSVFQRAMIPVYNLLESTQMTGEDIDEIVLVGGTTRVPKVKELLIGKCVCMYVCMCVCVCCNTHFSYIDYFGKELNDEIDPDITVAVGAATVFQ